MVQPAVLSTSVDIITPDVYGITLKSTTVDIYSYSNSNRCLLKLV